MTTKAMSRPALTMLHRRMSAVAIVHFLTDRFLWLPMGALIALVWANTLPDSYFRAAHALAFPVNEILMALFLGLIAQEAIEAVIPGGALSTWRRWAMPLIAASGGLLGSTFAYLGYISWRHEQVLAQAWPVACAIDVAAGYYVLKTIFRGRTASNFFLIIGLASSVVGVLILAVWPVFTQDHLGGAVLLTLAVVLAAALRRARVHAFWPSLIGCGSLSWLAFRWAGVHPALALLPIVPFLPHRARRDNPFTDPDAGGEVPRVEREWNVIAQVALFLFGLVNAGVILRGVDTGSWAVLVAALLGRPLGVLGAVALGLTVGFHLPPHLRWRELTVIALATSSGFTFALFAAASLLPPGAVLMQIKLGALSTVIGAAATWAVARWLHVGRFGGPATHA